MRKFFKSKFLKVVVVAVVAAAVGLFLIERNFFSNGVHTSSGAIQKRLVGDTLNCTIFLDANLNPSQPALKFATSLVRKFSEQHSCVVNIEVEENTTDGWDSVITGESDVIIFNLSDTIPSPYDDYTEHTIAVEDNYCCVVKLGNDLLLDNINYWIAHYKQTGEYEKLLASVKKLRSHSKYGFGLTRYTISQYDGLVKKYSQNIGWDWRLLSALIYQESKFNQGVVSRMGAIGLMQVMESTAQRYRVDDIYNPEENIRAGVGELSRLQRRYKKMGADSTNLLILTIAAYNCGDGKMDIYMKKAQQEGLDKTDWDNLAQFASKETVAHVEKTLRQYDLYRLSVVE